MFWVSDSNDPDYAYRHIRAELSNLIRGYHKDYFGRGPVNIWLESLGVLTVVRSSGVLLPHEQRFLEGLAPEEGVRRLRRLREAFFEASRPAFLDRIASVVGVGVEGLVYDLFPALDEDVLVIRLRSTVLRSDEEKDAEDSSVLDRWLDGDQ